MDDRRSQGAAHAFADGMSRVAAAPVLLAGTIALVLFYGAPVDLRSAAGALLLWAFFSGGILDRYARRRATRAAGFSGACGAHFGAMLRLGLVMLLVIALFHAVVGSAFANPYVHKAGFVLALTMFLLLSFAQVRIAVEDRRSAVGALFAGARFVLRNPSAMVLYVFAGLLIAGTQIAYESTVRTLDSESAALALTDTAIAIETTLLLVWLASAIAFFQGRLAHAGYTAAPPLLWPESPAAEAIGHAAPGHTP